MTARLGHFLGAAGYIAAALYAYFVIGFPDGYRVSQFSMQIQLFVLAFVLALLIRSFWAVVMLPATVIFSVVLAGIIGGLIRDGRQFVAATFNLEVFMFSATALGALLGTAIPRIARRIRRALAEPDSSELLPKEPAPDGHEPPSTP